MGTIAEHFPQIPIVFDHKKMFDAMDVTTGLIDQRALFSTRWMRQTSLTFSRKFVVILSLAFQPLAYSQVVDVALEPTLASFESPQPANSVQTQSNANEAVTESSPPAENEEASSKSNAKKKVQNFIPQQRPIGQVNIDLRTKPKNGSTTVPEDLTVQTSAVYASTSDEIQSELFYTKSRNRDEIFAYQPLYFEEVNLERYGRNCGALQPAVSSLRFFATIPLLPYAMTTYHPSTTYTRKWPYEAGWGAPRVREFEPLKLKPSLVQAGAITGLVFVLP
jgi:hypothetical protein